MSQNQEVSKSKNQKQWQIKLSELESQLLQARIEQINLKRINRNLQQTLRTALVQQQRQTLFSSTQRINFSSTWKQKYEHQVQKNIGNQIYVKILKTKKLAQSPQGMKSVQRNMGLKSNLKIQNKSTKHQFIQKQNYGISDFRSMKRSNSVKKMQNFMDKLLREKYEVAEFRGNSNYNCVKSKQKRSKASISYEDPIQQMFCSLKPIQKKNFHKDSEQEGIPSHARLSLNTNRKPLKSIINAEIQKSYNKKQSLTLHFR